MPSNYTVAEERAIAEELRRNGRAGCPRCPGRLQPRPVPRPPEVSYVRTRRWLICAGCKRSVVLDSTESPRPRPAAGEAEEHPRPRAPGTSDSDGDPG